MHPVTTAATSSSVPRSTFRRVAPAGSPIGAGDLARWTGRLASSADAREALRQAVAARFGVSDVFPISTGRAGMTLLLQALSQLAPDRTDVLVPAYTCFSVPASVAKAGLRPRVIDIDPHTLDFDAEALEAADTSRVLAVVATNLYGFPNDLPRLTAWARARGVFVVDDAAQAMGATVGGRPSGTWGDVGLYSLDKGKNISAIDGGLIVTSSAPVARALAQLATRLAPPSMATVAGDLLKVLVYSAFLPPSRYWIPASIPGLGLGETRYTLDFPLAQMPSSLAALALTMLPRLDAYNATRIANAADLARGAEGLAGVTVLSPIRDATPVSVRLPLLVEPGPARRQLLAELDRAGIGATGSYPSAIVDIPALATQFAGVSTPGGRAVAERIVTLPTHPLLSASDRARITDILRRTLGTAHRPAAAAAS